MSTANHFLCPSGLETNQSYDTFWYHTDKCTVDLGGNTIVPMHFKYDYVANKPKNADMRYDYVMFSERFKEEQRAGNDWYLLLFQMGTQMVTFTYQTPLKIQHYVFPFSRDMEAFFWFVSPDMLRTAIQEYLVHFMNQVQKELRNETYEYEHHGVKMPHQVFVVSAFRDEDDIQKMYRQYIENAIKNAFGKDNGFEVQPTVPYQRFEKNSRFTKDEKVPVFVQWYRGRAFNQTFKIENIEPFQHIVKQYQFENSTEINPNYSTSEGRVHLEAVIPRDVTFPIAFQSAHRPRGFVRWLIFGDILTSQNGQERMYLGIGWFPEANGQMPCFFPIRLDPDAVGCV